MNSLTNLTPQQLRRAADLKERVDALQTQLEQLLGAPAIAATSTTPQKRKMSRAGRAAIAAAARARWARIKGLASPGQPVQKPKRKMSAAVKARLSAMAKARWQKARAAGKTTL